MEGFVAQKLNEFENGKISRRKLIEALTVAATSATATGGAQAPAIHSPRAGTQAADGGLFIDWSIG